METVDQARETILKELTSDDTEVRDAYLKHFSKDVEQFSKAMAEAFVNWRGLDSGAKDNEKLAYVSALVFNAITLHILSMRLFISGHSVAAGNLFRQVLETVALALLCSSKELSILQRFIDEKYSTNDAIRDVNRQTDHLGVNKDAVDVLKEAHAVYHAYSHPSHLTIAASMSFSKEGLYVGAAFDEGKLESYTNEVKSRVGLAVVFSSFVDGVKVNIAKW